MKPPPAIAAFDDEIRVPKTAQEMDLDYEGELVRPEHLMRSKELADMHRP